MKKGYVMTIKMRLVDKPDTIKKVDYPFVVNPHAVIDAIEASGDMVVEYNVRLATKDDYKLFKVRDYQQTIEGYRKILSKMGSEAFSEGTCVDKRFYEIQNSLLKTIKNYNQFCKRNGITQELIGEEFPGPIDEA